MDWLLVGGGGVGATGAGGILMIGGAGGLGRETVGPPLLTERPMISARERLGFSSRGAEKKPSAPETKRGSGAKMSRMNLISSRIGAWDTPWTYYQARGKILKMSDSFL